MHVKYWTVKGITEGSDIMGLELSLEYSACSMMVLFAWRVRAD